MRIATLYDIHGNLPALEAVLQEVHQIGVDQIVVGGDIFPGALPYETLARLLDLDIPVQFIQGNGDRAVLDRMQGREITSVGEAFRPMIDWGAEQLPPEYEAILASWAKTLRLEIEGLGEVLFCHATPRNDMDVFTRLTPEDRLLPLFEGLNVSLVVCGHTHMQFDRTIGKVRVVNSGSVGMPFGEPGAYWLLLTSKVEFHFTPYNLTSAAERIRATTYPRAQEDAQNILQPRSEEEMVQLYTGFELK